jgi:hypothetical protein
LLHDKITFGGDFMQKTVVVGSYADAEKYLKVGWKISSIRPVPLPCTDKTFQEHTLIWDNDSEPVIPQSNANQ